MKKDSASFGDRYEYNQFDVVRHLKPHKRSWKISSHMGTVLLNETARLRYRGTSARSQWMKCLFWTVWDFHARWNVLTGKSDRMSLLWIVVKALGRTRSQYDTVFDVGLPRYKQYGVGSKGVISNMILYLMKLYHATNSMGLVPKGLLTFLGLFVQWGV